MQIGHRRDLTVAQAKGGFDYSGNARGGLQMPNIAGKTATHADDGDRFRTVTLSIWHSFQPLFHYFESVSGDSQDAYREEYRDAPQPIHSRILFLFNGTKSGRYAFG
uniref:Uncharacterized protein n=1 Tax=Candidatus Kentrum sp. DK TaxID=2126562 RepID=A0A450RU74_9GAMM|nr:MAG: hypothetical protein BECKDK2373B_GA0170837_100229 [Candidatus Kentron sp. DK]